MADLFYKSLKSGKLDNIDLTQQFILSILPIAVINRWKSLSFLCIDFLWLLVWQNFDLWGTVYVSSQTFYEGVDLFDDFK